MSAWQPIETAPKDVSVLCYDGVEGYYEGKLVEVMEFRGVGCASQLAWHWHNKSANRYSRPTHWMPLPDPPRRAVADQATTEQSARDRRER